MTTKHINVVTPSNEGDDFPEAEHYPEFVATQLAERYPGYEIDVSDGQRTSVSVFVYENGVFTEERLAMDGEIRTAVQVELWNEFCTDGYKAYEGLIP